METEAHLFDRKNVGYSSVAPALNGGYQEQSSSSDTSLCSVGYKGLWTLSNKWEMV